MRWDSRHWPERKHVLLTPCTTCRGIYGALFGLRTSNGLWQASSEQPLFGNSFEDFERSARHWLVYGSQLSFQYVVVRKDTKAPPIQALAHGGADARAAAGRKQVFDTLDFMAGADERRCNEFARWAEHCHVYRDAVREWRQQRAAQPASSSGHLAEISGGSLDTEKRVSTTALLTGK